MRQDSIRTTVDYLVTAKGMQAVDIYEALVRGTGVPIQVVAERLGHAQTSMTLDVYTHALPDMQR